METLEIISLPSFTVTQTRVDSVASRWPVLSSRLSGYKTTRSAHSVPTTSCPMYVIRSILKIKCVKVLLPVATHYCLLQNVYQATQNGLLSFCASFRLENKYLTYCLYLIWYLKNFIFFLANRTTIKWTSLLKSPFTRHWRNNLCQYQSRRHLYSGAISMIPRGY